MTSLMPDGTGRTVNGMETLSDDYCFDETTWTNFDFIKCSNETEAKQVVRREVITRSEERHLLLASSLAVCDTQILLSKLKHDEKAVSDDLNDISVSYELSLTDYLTNPSEYGS